MKTSKARKEYQCFECKNTIQKNEEYTRTTRYDNPNDKLYGGYEKGYSQTICLKCIEENRYSYIDEKYNRDDIVKFGMYCGKQWNSVNWDYLVYLYENKKTHKYWSEIEKEYMKRLSLNQSNSIDPISDKDAIAHIESLKKKLLDIPKPKHTPQLTDVMREVYVKMLTESLKIKRLKYDYNSYYWLFVDAKNKKEIDNRTITALYKRGLLKPTKFNDNIQKRETSVVEYEAISDHRVSLSRWGNGEPR